MKKFFSSLLILLLMESSLAAGTTTNNTNVNDNKAQVVLLNSIKNVEEKTKENNLKNISKEKEENSSVSKQGTKKLDQPKNVKESATSKNIKSEIKNWLNIIVVATISTVSKVFDQVIKIVPYILLRRFL